MDNAASNGYLDIVQFLHQNRSEGCTTNAMDTAVLNNHMEVVQFLHAHRSEGCTPKALKYAVASGDLRLTQFLCINRPAVGCVAAALTVARGRQWQAMVEYLATQMPCQVSSVSRM